MCVINVLIVEIKMVSLVESYNIQSSIQSSICHDHLIWWISQVH